MKKISGLLLAFASVAAIAAYSVTVNFDAPVDGGPVVGYRLYQGCDNPQTKTLIAEVEPGQTIQGALATEGDHYLCMAAYNSTGEGALTETQRINIDDFDPVPGQIMNFRIEVECDSSCKVTVTGAQ